MSIDTPTLTDLAELSEHRHEASVTIYLSAEALGVRAFAHATEAAKSALLSSLHEALAELGSAGLARQDAERLEARVRDLHSDLDFWGTGARSVAIFVSPEELHAFRLMNELSATWSTGDRFDVGPMIRAATFAHTGYVLALTEGEVRLIHLDSSAASRPVELTDLPADASDALTREPAVGRFNRHRADGTLGPKPEQKRYVTIVQQAVLAAIADREQPLVLAASNDLERVYREANTHPRLLDQGIEANPASLSDGELEERARTILDEHYRKRILDWVEDFGTRQAHGTGSAQLSEVARAARSGQVAELLFDIDADTEGTIDEFGELSLADEPGPATYRVVDEIAAQVLHTGGRVRAVRADDMPGAAVVAAVFRG